MIIKLKSCPKDQYTFIQKSKSGTVYESECIKCPFYCGGCQLQYPDNEYERNRFLCQSCKDGYVPQPADITPTNCISDLSSLRKICLWPLFN